MHRWRTALPLFLFGLAALGPAPAGAAVQDPSSTCSVAWGVSVDGVPASLDPLTQLEAQVGRQAAIVHWRQGWQPDDNPRLDRQQLQAVRTHGSWPFISWEPEGIPLAEITSGQWDDYLDRWATTLADYGDPVLLAPLAEMDDPQHSYGLDAAANTAQDVVGAWRHIHDRLLTAGANNVLWVFNVAGQAAMPFESLYPGDDQVDWLALDAHNWSLAMDRPWTPLADLTAPPYQRLEAISRDKPVMLAEFGSVEDGGDKAQWLRDAGRDIPARFPQIKAVVYFNNRDPSRPAADWRLETTPASLAAARDAFGPGSVYCVTSAALTGDGLPLPSGPFRRTLSLAIPLLVLTLLFALVIGASKLPRPHL